MPIAFFRTHLLIIEYCMINYLIFFITHWSMIHSLPRWTNIMENATWLFNISISGKTVWTRILYMNKSSTRFLKSLFVLEINYELSPCLYFFVLDLLCHYSIVNACFWFYIFLNIGICCIEIALFLTTKLVLAQHCFIASFQLLVSIIGWIILNLPINAAFSREF